MKMAISRESYSQYINSRSLGKHPFTPYFSFRDFQGNEMRTISYLPKISYLNRSGSYLSIRPLSVKKLKTKQSGELQEVKRGKHRI